MSQTSQSIYDLVYTWGIKNHRIPMFQDPDDEIKHYGKLIQHFSENERLEFEQAMDELERWFEIGMCRRNIEE